MLTYLESLDSVRLQYGHEVDDAIGSNTRLQILTEALVTLGLGRSIITNQSFAIDSWAVQLLAGALGQNTTTLPPSGRGQYATRATPGLIVHLHHHDRYEQALAEVFVRMGRSAFHSSLWGDLNLTSHECAAIASALRGDRPSIEPLLDCLSDEPRAIALRAAWAQFRGQSRQHKPAAEMNRGEVNMHEAACALLADSERVVEEVTRDDPETEGSATSLLAAMAHLRDAASTTACTDVFARRSPVHSADPWPGLDRSARAELGEEQHGALVEFIDTLYNLVVADSIGLAPALASTRVVSATDREDAGTRLSVAQDLALKAYADAASRLGRGIESSYAGDYESLFSIEVQSQRVSDGMPMLARGASRIESEIRVREAIAAVMRARETNEEFQRSAAGLRRALSPKDASDVARCRDDLQWALESHIRTLSRILVDEVDVRPSLDIKGTAFELAIGVGSAGTTTLLTQTLDVSSLVNSAFAAMAALGVKPLVNRLRSRSRAVAAADAIGRCIHVTRGARSD